MFLDFAIMSVLLVVAHLLRTRVKLLQNLFIPTAIIAGFLGLLGGSQMFNLLPFAPKTVGPDSGVAAMADYPFYLVILLFATLLMGHRKKGPPFVTVARNVGDTFFYNLGSEIGMFGVAMLFHGDRAVCLVPLAQLGLLFGGRLWTATAGRIRGRPWHGERCGHGPARQRRL